MAEITSNVELAHLIHERRSHPTASFDQWIRRIEIAEAIVLAAVAVATAWSGYQASKWDALSGRNYSLASRTTVMAQAKMALAGQDRLYDIVTFNGWVGAKTARNDKLTALFESRFRPEYTLAFIAWQKLDPFNNLAAPAGPIFMAEYRNANALESAKLDEEARGYFEKAVNARETGDDYVKVTVVLATVLLMTALGQKFEIPAPRIVVLLVALILLAIGSYRVLTFPRA